MSGTISTVEQTVVSGDIVTTTTETKTMNRDHSVTTTTTVDKTDHADEDNHITTLCEMTSISPDLDKQIIRQIEYYFSDVNMVRDKFLQNEAIKDDGWIPLSVLTTFKRLQILTTDFKTIMKALRKSFSGLLQLNETENKIRRHPNRPLAMNQEELDSSLKNRTIFVKGFPMTDDDVTLDKLLHFFDKYGSTDNIQMKKDYKTKHFNGLVSVVFPSEEKARGFMEHSKRTPVKYDDGSILECSFQNDQSKEKKQKELPTKSNETLANLTGALIHLAGMAANATRELIKEKFNPFTKTPWIDFNKGDTEAWVRLNEANTAKDVLDKVLAAGDGKLIIGDNQVTTRIVQGEEEAEFWKEANEERSAQRSRKRGRRDGYKRKNSQETEFQSTKKVRDTSTD